jgi:type II secretory pathway pseudopilin PulG
VINNHNLPGGRVPAMPRMVASQAQVRSGYKKAAAFSFAELLITLAIIGVLAAFLLPKVLISSNTNTDKNNKKTSQAAWAIMQAYEQYRLTVGTVPTTMTPSTLTPYMNYVSMDTSGTTMDTIPGAASVTCIAATPCLRLHNGGLLRMNDNYKFGGSSTLNGVYFIFDPDPVNNTTSTADGPLKAVGLLLYYDGSPLITTRGTVRSGTAITSVATGLPLGFEPDSTLDPSWFTGGL